MPEFNGTWVNDVLGGEFNASTIHRRDSLNSKIVSCQSIKLNPKKIITIILYTSRFGLNPKLISKFQDIEHKHGIIYLFWNIKFYLKYRLWIHFENIQEKFHAMIDKSKYVLIIIGIEFIS